MSDKKYHIYFFCCRAHIPLHFALHTWIVIITPEESVRFEVLYKKDSSQEHFGYIHKNYYPPEQGIRKISGSLGYWKSRLIGNIQGDEGSLAEQIVIFMKDHSSHYPFKELYRSYQGPNSNTYTAWILSKFPEAGIQLPWNAFGKNYLK